LHEHLEIKTIALSKENALANFRTMNHRLKNMVFYILIIDGEAEDHSRLRNTINRMIPQSYIESIYSHQETISYFNNLKLPPSLIILDARMDNTALRLAIYMVRQNIHLKRVPLVLVNSELDLNQKRELKYMGVNEFYMKLDNPIEMRVMTNDIKNRWLLPEA
jgi:PleD family two-component response regulator